MATYAYDDFRVVFTPRGDGTYDLRATAPDGAVVETVFTVPLGGEDLERAVLGVARSRASDRTRRASAAPGAEASVGEPTRDVGRNRVRDDGVGAPTELGGLLADALLAGPLRDAYDRAVQAADDGRHGVRMTLSLAASPALLSVPWEFLYRRPVFLASQRRTPVVRLLDAGRRVPPPVIEDVVRILAVVASPSDLTPLAVEEERERIRLALSAVVGMNRVEVTWLDPATPRGLQAALRDGSFHVLHYVGHSDFTAAGDGVLYLQRSAKDRSAEPVDSTLLANLLADQRTLRLVVLNSCEGARTALDDPYAGVATTLVQLGVPAVIAMQFEISDAAAVLFAEELYANLIARQFPIDAAVAEARKALYAEIGRGEWATPVLFLQDPDVAVFEFRRDAEGLPAPPPPGSTTGRTLPPERASPLPVAAIHAGFVDAGREADAPAPADLPAPTPWRRRGILAGGGVLLLLAAALAGGRWLGGVDMEGSAATTTTDAATTTTVGVTTTVAPAADVEFPELRLGAEGPAVAAAQHLLRAHGHDVEATGFYDRATARALEAFEEEAEIIVDGILGPLTWSELVEPVSLGSAGEAVEAAQVLLAAEGADVAVDGRFNAAVRAATVDLEREHGLHVDGVVDPELWKVLTSAATES